VFDAVGTLIYPEPSAARVYAAVGQRFGSRKTRQQIRAAFRQAFEAEEQRDLEGDLATDETYERGRWRRIVRAVLDDAADPGACFDELWAHFAQPGAWRLYEDARKVLDVLHQRRIRVAIASNFDSRLEKICRGLPALSQCHPVLTSSRVGRRKPHPAMFQAVQQALALPAGEILHVGDDLVSDYQGARAVGWQGRLICRQGHNPPLGARVQTVATLAEVLHEVAGGWV
jgi:putative hydrolase of the HAD superfamily